MNTVGEREVNTQGRVIHFFQDALGYTYLSNWQERADNTIKKTLSQLKKAAAIGGNRTLSEANREVYGLLRYGVKVQPATGDQFITVRLIDWKNPHNNDFGTAEEVTLEGENTKRPDLVLYINGIAIGVLELKRSTV